MTIYKFQYIKHCETQNVSQEGRKHETDRKTDGLQGEHPDRGCHIEGRRPCE